MPLPAGALLADTTLLLPPQRIQSHPVPDSKQRRDLCQGLPPEEPSELYAISDAKHYPAFRAWNSTTPE